MSQGGRHEHKSATSAGGCVDSRHFDTRSASFCDMDHRDLFGHSRRTRSDRQITAQDLVLSQDDGRACLFVPGGG